VCCRHRAVAAPAVPLVQVDNRLGARMATEHLLSLGHRRIAHIAGAPARISEERLLGYQAALVDAGVEGDSSLVAMGAFTEAGGYEAMRALMTTTPRPTAVFAANDLSAIGAMSAVAAAGGRAPAHRSILGVDDDLSA